MEQVPVDDVIIGDRVRKDAGDIRGLANSMESVGQLQAIGIDGDNRLLFGHRRLLAAMLLNWSTIGCERITSLDGAAKALQAERDENTERKEFLPSERREMARRLDALTPRAKPGPKPAADGPEELHRKLRQNSDPVKAKPKSREKTIADAVGVSPRTLDKINAVVEAAEQPDAPEEVKAAAEEMDRTGNVDRAYKAVKTTLLPVPPREAIASDEPGFDLSGARITAAKSIRAIFRAWPDWARSEIATFLRKLAKEDW